MPFETGLLTGLAEGIKSGMASYQDARRTQALEKKMAEEQEAALEDRAFKQKQFEASQEKDRTQGLLEARSKGLLPAYDENKKITGYDYDPEYYALKKREAAATSSSDPLKRALAEEKLSGIRNRNEERELSLEVPGVGKAITPKDAEELKQAKISKDEFDSAVQEMIDLRKKYGGEAFNREAVERGKQLSKKALLSYKNMAKLGVLSKSDEDIINAIIPEDPLGFSAAGLLGQDPTMTRLQKFREDTERNFGSQMGVRLRPGQQVAQSPVDVTPDDAMAELARRRAAKSGTVAR